MRFRRYHGILSIRSRRLQLFNFVSTVQLAESRKSKERQNSHLPNRHFGIIGHSSVEHRHRTDIRFGFSGGALFKGIGDFVSHRLGCLEACTPLVADHKPEEFHDVFHAILEPLRQIKWPDSNASHISKLLHFEYSDLQSAACEIVRFTEFDRLERYISDAKQYKAAPDSFGRGLAGLAQNVLDFDDQDEHEVSDSLTAAGAAGGYFHFVNAKTLVRFYRKSRSFDRMRNFIGGDPYFFFTSITASYNEYLINRAAEVLSELKPGLLIEAPPLDSTKKELEKRYTIFAAYLRAIIPNAFRYHTEAALFDHIYDRRGLTARRQLIEKELAHYETIAHDFENLNLQRSSMRMNVLIIILAVWSAFGALATAAGLFVAFQTDMELHPSAVGELALSLAQKFPQPLMEGFLWAAFFAFSAALALSVAFLATSATSLIRYREATHSRK